MCDYGGCRNESVVTLFFFKKPIANYCKTCGLKFENWLKSEIAQLP
jgi:hypothetical protein